MTLSKIIKLLLLQFICVFLIIQIGLAAGGFSFFTILIWSFVLFCIVYLGFLYPRWSKQS